jgi:hypothetical protein
LSTDENLILNNPTPPSRLTFKLDGGANVHCVGEKHLLQNYKPIRSLVEPITGDSVISPGYGDLPLETGTLKNVLWLPEATRNILSTTLLLATGVRIVQEGRQMSVYSSDGKPLFTTNLSSDNEWIQDLKTDYNSHEQALNPPENERWKSADQKISSLLAPLMPQILPQSTSQPKLNADNTRLFQEIAPLNLAELWHRRFGHMSFSTMLKHKPFFKGINIPTSHIKNAKCLHCAAAKAKAKSFDDGKGKKKSTAPLQYFHADTSGLNTPLSVHGNKYYIVFVDDWTGYTYVYFTRRLADFVTVLDEFWTDIRGDFNAKEGPITFDTMHGLRTDGGGEFCSTAAEA